MGLRGKVFLSCCHLFDNYEKCLESVVLNFNEIISPVFNRTESHCPFYFSS